MYVTSASNPYLAVYRDNSGINISEELKNLLERPIQAYTSRLKQAVHDLIIKDIRVNLKNHVPVCYQNQVCSLLLLISFTQIDREKTIYFAYSITQLVPDYHIKWWRSTYLSIVYAIVEELFLKRVDL
jgi:hypothetical protein